MVPTFLLLSEEDRDIIRAHIQVETFAKGAVIYEENEHASAFFIVREGTGNYTANIAT